MHRFLVAVSAMLFGAFVVAGAAQAQPSGGRSASSFWFDSYGRRTDQQQIHLNQAIADQQGRSGGYGPGNSTTNVYGDVNTHNTYNGDVSTSTVLNTVNSNQTTTTITGSPGSNVQTGTTQTTNGGVTQTGESYMFRRNG